MSWLALTFIIFAGIGIPVLLAAAYYWTDLETRKGHGWNWLKDKGFYRYPAVGEWLPLGVTKNRPARLLPEGVTASHI